MVAIVQNVTHERARIDNALQQLGDQAITDLGNNIALHQEVLEGSAAWWTPPRTSPRREFDTYTDDMLVCFPTCRPCPGTRWSPSPAWQPFEAKQRAQPGRANFTVTERDAVATCGRSHRGRNTWSLPTSEPPRQEPQRAGLRHLLQPGPRRRHREGRDTGRAIATAPSTSSRSPAPRRAC